MIKTFKNTFYMLQYIKKYSKSFIYVVLGLAIISSLISIISIQFVRIALNEVITNKSFNNLIIILSAYLLMLLIVSHLNSFITQITIPISSQKFKSSFHKELYDKASIIELIKYDDPVFFNKFVIAINNSDTRALSVINTYSSLLTSILSSTGLIFLILSIQQFQIIFLVVVNVIFSTYLSSISAKYNHNLSLLVVEADRKASYVHRVFYQNNYACDIRSSQIKDVLLNYLHSSTNTKLDLLENWGRKNFKILFLQNILQSVTTISTMAYLAYLFISDKILAGDFAAILSSVNLLISSLKNMFSAIPQLIEHSLFIDNFKEFLHYNSIDDTKKKIAIDNITEINIQNCSFGYDKSKLIIREFNFKIKIGEKIGLVGSNGSGKSTLIKLLLGLYEPLKGTITFNNTNNTEISKESLLNNFSILFQNVQIYATSIAENVLMKKYNYSEDETNLVKDALESVGLWEKVSALEKGILTPLLREFDENGVVFSTGEFQKLALARVFAKSTPFIILDEPFNHLDNNSINLILNNLLIKKSNSSIIMITHEKDNLSDFDKIYEINNQN